MKTEPSFSSNCASWRRAVVKIATIAPVLAAMAGVSVSCAATDEGTVVLGEGSSDGGGTGPFDPGADSASYRPDSSGGICATSECPAGRGTCPDKPFPCENDLLWDDANCGACGHECPIFPAVHAATTCMDGVCVLQCEVMPFYGAHANCNGHLEDGCEVNLSFDKNNCGGCGVVCPNQHDCISGVCVCSIAGSCGACGNVCPPPPASLPAIPSAWNASYGCSSGECNKLVCNDGFTDCNGDLGAPAGDGCETNILVDSANCNGCGIACARGAFCDLGSCQCPCGESCFDELGSDPNNCGACNVHCEAAPGADPLCNDGVCETRCFSGRADCDHDLANGCETNVLSDPFNCGGCGVHCDGVEGQACVEGRCTVKECPVR